MELRDRRIEYNLASLDDGPPVDPLQLFDNWLAEAIAAQEARNSFEATAMTLATVSQLPDGSWQPETRIVLLKSFDESGFGFFSNYNSAKGQAMAANPRVSLHFYWAEVHRQIRIDGLAQQMSRQAAEEYFAERPRGSQLAAWASQQSAPATSRSAMLEQYALAEDKFENQEVPCPPHWGGYLVVPDRIEFWQGRPSRFHDRICYQRQADSWQQTRLNP